MRRDQHRMAMNEKQRQGKRQGQAGRWAQRGNIWLVIVVSGCVVTLEPDGEADRRVCLVVWYEAIER